MPVRIEFSTSNAAFGDDPSGPDASEIADCLQRIVKAYSNGQNGGAVRDSNGNTVGRWSATIDAEESK